MELAASLFAKFLESKISELITDLICFESKEAKGIKITTELSA